MYKVISFEEYKNRKEENYIFTKEEENRIFEHLCCDDDYEFEDI